jgi:phage repressor protein C with HTH and peptisase S24 domain
MMASVLNDLDGLILRMSLADRIKEAMGDTITKAELARAAGVTASAVTHWLNGATHSLSAENADAIERKTGYRASWIISGKGPKKVFRQVEPDFTGPAAANVIPISPMAAAGGMQLRQIPVKGTARMGENGYYEELGTAPGAGDGHLLIAIADPDAYVLRVRGSSMSPAIRDGWYVVIGPSSAPAVGEFVLLKLHSGQKMVKELLIQRPGSVEIMSVNGGERRTIYADELESMVAVVAVVPPSLWQPG